MKQNKERKILDDIERIPGVGKAVAKDVCNLVILKISDLKEQNPEDLYKDLCRYQGCKVDRCMLYVFRCAVYTMPTAS